jgi:hypothetical protein
MVPEPEGSSPHSQQPANGPYPEPGVLIIYFTHKMLKPLSIGKVALVKLGLWLKVPGTKRCASV